MSALITQIEDAIVQRLVAVLTVVGNPQPSVEVRAWPNDPRSYKMLHPHGAVLVVYKGSNYDYKNDTVATITSREADYEVSVQARTLREHQPPAGVAPSPVNTQGQAVGLGIHDLLEIVGGALGAWVLPQATAGARIKSEQFDDYTEGVWGYSIKLAVPLVRIFDGQEPIGLWTSAICANAPPLTQTTFVPS